MTRGTQSLPPGGIEPPRSMVARSTVWCLTLAAVLTLWMILPSIRGILSVVVVLHFIMLAWGIADLRMQFFCRALRRGLRTSRAVALTFDDGPDPAITPEILDTLKRHGVTATFFVVGQRAERCPDIVRRAFDEGHAIACHDLDHSIFANFRLVGGMTRDIRETCETIHRIIGVTPLLYRPPVGLTNPHTPGALQWLGMRCIGWSRSARDGGNRIEANIRRIHALAEPGGVILLHDVVPKPELRDAVLREVEGLCLSIKEQGLQPVTVGRMFGVKEYRD